MKEKTSSNSNVDSTLNNLNSNKAFNTERKILKELFKIKLQRKLRFVNHSPIIEPILKSLFTPNINESVQSSLFDNTSVQSSLFDNTSIINKT